MVRLPRRSVGERLRRGRSIGELLEEELAFARAGPFKEGAFPSRLHSERIAAILGVALGVAFLTCFATGLISHFAQRPADLGFFSMPAAPAWLYRFTQGLHVAAGTAAIPLLVAKLWTVFPRLFAWPPVRDVAHLVERLSLIPLVAGSVFMLTTGLINTSSWAPWTFNFTAAHFWTSLITIGALVTHIGAQLPATRRGLSRAVAREPEPAGTGLTRRGMLISVGAAAGVATLTTVGQTVQPLRELALLAPRHPGIGPQGIPVNKSAVGASVVDAATSSDYTLTLVGREGQERSLTLEELRALPRHEAVLAITCVEGWSATARWSGVRVRDLAEMVGASDGAEVMVRSLQQGGSYAQSRLNVPHVRHDNTLLALEINGEPLHIDHGFPARLISPNRPGVQQTKWVARMEVL
ncbi:MAG: molybdopterin-dependent oxidoreductase [Actinomycetota bacterium]|nr:molybdopterin-dependent oxidoreductase [Actinomycetota bacterium]